MLTYILSFLAVFPIATAMPTGKNGGSSDELNAGAEAASPRSPSEGSEVGRVGGQTHVVTDHEGKPQATTVLKKKILKMTGIG